LKSKLSNKKGTLKEYNIQVEGIVRSTHTKEDIEKELAIRFSDALFQTFRIKVTEI
jgi:hypothetical protein